MIDLGVEVPPLAGKPPRSHTVIATFIWVMVALPFLYLALPSIGTGPRRYFPNGAAGYFGLTALACLLIATIAPTKYRVAIVGARVRAWGDLL